MNYVDLGINIDGKLKSHTATHSDWSVLY